MAGGLTAVRTISAAQRLRLASTAPTQSVGDASTKLATTAFVAGTAFSAALPGQTGNSGKFLTTDGSEASFRASGVIRIDQDDDLHGRCRR